MINRLGVALLALAAMPAAALAGWDCNYSCSPSWTVSANGLSSDNGCGCCCDCPACCGKGPCRCFPWYLYWPYDAHFQTPAPTKFACPPPMTPGYYPCTGCVAGAPAPMPYGMPAQAPQPLPQAAPAASSVQPIGYFQQPQAAPASYGLYPSQAAPSYWYGR